MKKTLAIAVTAALTLGVASSTWAGEKKNQPKNKNEVLKMLEEVGGDHNPERIKVYKVGTIEAGDSFLHIWNGALKEGGYRILIFDNTPAYLGYIPTNFEPVDYGESEVLLNSGGTDADGGTIHYVIPIKGGDLSKQRFTIDGVPTKFIPVPKKEEEKAAAGETEKKEVGLVVVEDEKEDPNAIAYREWTVNMKGTEIKFRGIYVSHDVKKKTVTVKNEKSGTTADIDFSALSAADVEYMKQLIEKQAN